jgi:outer membrane protein OmpA-like peptidoglycan-associated protein
MRVIGYVSVFLCLSQFGFAQTDSLKLSDHYFSEGMVNYNFSHSKEAIQLFQLSIKANPNNSKAYLMAGKAMMQTTNKEAALLNFKKAYSLNQSVDEDILFLIGQAYHYNELFDSALLYYDLMNQSLAKSLRYSRVMKMNEVNWKIFECRNAIVFKANPVKATIMNLGSNINSEFADYAPTISADESIMIFTTRRPKKNDLNQLDEPEFYEEIFQAKRTNGAWQQSKSIDEINSAFNDASVSISPDGKQMFVYGDENGGDIYETDLQTDGKWSRPKRLNGFINSPYYESSAATNAQEDKLFFVSDRPGGYGGTDIFLSVKNKRGEWGEAQNLGPIINTERDEEDVFISSNGRHLYFSSNGHPGMGGLDIYRSEFDSSKMEWSEPMNLGYPINSVENDIYFVLNGSEQYAYFSSARKDSYGGPDIYGVDLKDWKPVSRKSLEELELAGIHQAAIKSGLNTPAGPQSADNRKQLDWQILVKDAKTNHPITALLTSANNLEVAFEKIGEGNYQSKISYDPYREYRISISAKGYQPEMVAVKFSAAQANSKFTQTILLKQEANLLNGPTSNFSLFYETGYTGPLHREVLDIVVVRLKADPSATVIVSSNTDSNGDEAKNLELSKKRAEEVKSYLMRSGIADSRIETIALGESKPQGDNATTAGRRMNRRTDLLIQTK